MGFKLSRILALLVILASPLYAAEGPKISCGALSIVTTSVVWTPDAGCDAIELYSGISNEWQGFRSAAITVTPTVIASTRYDIFFYRVGTQVLMQRGPAWASSVSRGTGVGSTEIVRQNGVWVNANALTGLCAARLCRFVGTLQVSSGGALAIAQAVLSGTFTDSRQVSIPDADSITVVPKAPTANQFVSGVGTDGVIAQRALAAGDIPALSVDSSKMTAVHARKICNIVIGDKNASAIVSGQLGPQANLCYIEGPATVVEIIVEGDTGTSSVIVGRMTAGAGAFINLLNGALATAAAGARYCSKTTTAVGLDGVTTCTNTVQNTALAAGDTIGLVSGTAVGGTKLYTVHVLYVLN